MSDNYKTRFSNKLFYTNVLIGAGIGFAATMAVLAILALIMVIFNIGDSFSSPLASVSAAIGSILGGWISGVKNKKKGIINGLLVATLIFLLITFISVFFNDKMTFMSLLHFIIIYLAACIGGIAGVNKSEKRKII